MTLSGYMTDLDSITQITKFPVIFVDRPFTDQELSAMTNGQTTWFVNREIQDIEVFENFDWHFVPVGYEAKNLHIWIWPDRSFWLAKLIPARWDGNYVQYITEPKRRITVSTYYNGDIKQMVDFLPPTYDLKYEHVWLFDTSTTDGADIEAVRISYVYDPQGLKIVDKTAKNQFKLVKNPALPDSIYTGLDNSNSFHYSQGKYRHVWNLAGDVELPNYDVWAYSLEPDNFVGTVLEGKLEVLNFYENMKWETNPLFDNISFKNFEYNYRPLADKMNLTHTWYLDSSHTPPGERIWAVRLTPSDSITGELDMGEIELNLQPKIQVNPDFQLYDWSNVTNKFVPSYDSLQFLHVWFCEGTDKKYGVKISYVTNTQGYKEHGYARPFMTEWSIGPGDTKLYWHFDKNCFPVPQWNKKFMPSRGNENKVHVFTMTNPKTGRVTEWSGCYLVPQGIELTDKHRRSAIKCFEHGCTEEEFDIVFLSNNEPYADSNYTKLEKLVHNKSKLHRVNGVKGILEAHKAAANLVTTNMFYLVDADCVLEGSFAFDLYPKPHDRNVVYVWHVKNPVNGLTYGYGGVKLFPTRLLKEATAWRVDLATSIGAGFKVIPRVIGTTEFNCDPETAWRSGFREAAKLASKVIKNQIDSESDQRLQTWCTVNLGVDNGEYAVQGACAGRAWIQNNKDSIDMINDYDWLHTQWLNYESTK